MHELFSRMNAAQRATNEHLRGRKKRIGREKRKEKEKTQPFRSWTSVCRKSLVCALSDSTDAPNYGESMQPHVCRALFSTFLALPPSRPARPPLPSSRPLVSHSLRYLCTLRSRTHVVVRMHTRACTRRVLRKLAPYASIQISHLATCVPTPSELPMCSLSSSSLFLLSIPLSDAFILSNLTDSYHSLTLTRNVVLNSGKRRWNFIIENHRRKSSRCTYRLPWRRILDDKTKGKKNTCF